MRPRPPSPRRLEGLEKTHAEEPRTHFLFVAADDSDAEIEAQRDRLIAEGKASANDRFIPFCWQDR
jgi:hypothetical protein